MPLDLSQSSIYREAEARGIAKGVVLDEARGRAEGVRGMLELRFGPAGAEVSDQVLEQLALKPDRVQLIADADSLDDLLHQLTN